MCVFQRENNKEGLFSSLGVKIGDSDLRQAVAAYLQSADYVSIQWYRDLVLKDDQDTAEVLLIIQAVAAAEAPIELAEITEQLGSSKRRIRRLP